MKAMTKIANPEDFEVTITLSMKMSELRQLREMNAENEKACHYPLSELTKQLRETCEQIDRVYSGDIVDLKSCPQCGNEFNLVTQKFHWEKRVED
jgi:4-hydroxy-3-methylbut-2-en-1-yl diphosphate synthase IspG/GcpE